MAHPDRNLVAHIYNPVNQSKEELIDGFVVRNEQFQKIYKQISEATMKHPEQHLLLEGKRGMGKTTMLWRIAYEIENDKKLNDWLLPIVFNEEEYGINQLYKLWERIAELLEEKSDDFYGLFEDMDERFSNYQKTSEYELDIFSLLSKRLEEKGKKVILFVDNFGDIVDKFKPQEIQRFREVLENSNNLRIVAASSVVLEATYGEKRHAFYGAFKVFRLASLNQKETEQVLLKLGEFYKQESIKEIIKNQKGRVESLRRLTGGVIRSIVLMFEIFVEKQAGNAFNDLEAILDKVTPLYKHRMDDLPAQQQEIMQAIAMAWDAVNTKEISKITRIPSKTVSAQLRQLEKNELVTKILTSTKNHLYQINERFFNIWYLMRHGRKGDKRRVLWLVRFLEEWCDSKDLESRVRDHITSLKSGTYDVRGAYFMTEAMAHTKHISLEVQKELYYETKTFLETSKSEFLDYLSESDLDLWEKGKKLYVNGKEKEAIETIEKIKKDKEFALGSFHKTITKNIKKAEEFYLKAIEKGHVDALNNLAVLYSEQKNFEKAEEFYLKAIEKGHVGALYNLAILYSEQKDIEKAEEFYLKAIEKGHVGALYNLAILYSEQKNFEKAEEFYLKAIEKGDVDSLYNLAVIFLMKKQINPALKYLKKYREQKNNFDSDISYSIALTFANQSKKAISIMELIWYEEAFLNEYEEEFNLFLRALLASENYEKIYEYFTSEKGENLALQDRLKPFYYATLFFLKDKYHDEYLRMGPELKETVDEIIQKVENLREEFKDLK